MANGAERHDKSIKINYLTPVEGEGSIYVRAEGGELRDVKLNTFEPPRFF